MPYDDESTSHLMAQPVWNCSDGLVAACLHGAGAVVTMAATIAHSGAPPATPGALQKFVVLHDGAITFKRVDTIRGI